MTKEEAIKEFENKLLNANYIDSEKFNILQKIHFVAFGQMFSGGCGACIRNAYDKVKDWYERNKQ
jgi:hypothetical protein